MQDCHNFEANSFTSQVPGQPGLQRNISSQNKGQEKNRVLFLGVASDIRHNCGKSTLTMTTTMYPKKDLPLGLTHMEVGWEHVTCASWEFKMGQMMYPSPSSPETLL